MKKKVTYKRFLSQILYLSKKGLKAENIRSFLKYSNSKRAVPSKNVNYLINFLFINFNFLKVKSLLEKFCPRKRVH